MSTSSHSLCQSQDVPQSPAACQGPFDVSPTDPNGVSSSTAQGMSPTQRPTPIQTARPADEADDDCCVDIVIAPQTDTDLPNPVIAVTPPVGEAANNRPAKGPNAAAANLPTSICAYYLNSIKGIGQGCLRVNCKFFHGTEEQLAELRRNHKRRKTSGSNSSTSSRSESCHVGGSAGGLAVLTAGGVGKKVASTCSATPAKDREEPPARLRMVKDAELGNKRPIVCLNYLTDTCHRPGCRFLHLPSNVRPLPMTVCDYFATGTCTRKRCRFFHGTQAVLSRMHAQGVTMYNPITNEAHDPAASLEELMQLQERTTVPLSAAEAAPPLGGAGALMGPAHSAEGCSYYQQHAPHSVPGAGYGGGMLPTAGGPQHAGGYGPLPPPPPPRYAHGHHYSPPVPGYGHGHVGSSDCASVMGAPPSADPSLYPFRGPPPPHCAHAPPMVPGSYAYPHPHPPPGGPGGSTTIIIHQGGSAGEGLPPSFVAGGQYAPTPVAPPSHMMPKGIGPVSQQYTVVTSGGGAPAAGGLAGLPEGLLNAILQQHPGARIITTTTTSAPGTQQQYLNAAPLHAQPNHPYAMPVPCAAAPYPQVQQGADYGGYGAAAPHWGAFDQ